LEALAVGLPSISTSISGIPEIIEHEKNGLLAEEKNQKQIAEMLERLLLSDKLREEYASVGRKIAEEKFSLKSNAGKLYQMFIDNLKDNSNIVEKPKTIKAS